MDTKYFDSETDALIEWLQSLLQMNLHGKDNIVERFSNLEIQCKHKFLLLHHVHGPLKNAEKIGKRHLGTSHMYLISPSFNNVRNICISFLQYYHDS